MICFTDVESSGLDERTGHLLEVAVVVTDDDLVEVAAIDTVVQPVGIYIDKVEMEPIVREMHEKNGLLAELRAGGGMRRYEAEECLVSFVRQVYSTIPDVETGKCICGEKREAHVGYGGNLNCFRPVGDSPLPMPRPHRLGGVELDIDTPLNLEIGYHEKYVSALSQTPLAGSTVAFDRRWEREHIPKFEALFSYRSVDVSSFTEMAKRRAPEIYKNRPKAQAAHRALADVRESITYLRYYEKSGFIGVPAQERVSFSLVDGWTLGPEQK